MGSDDFKQQLARGYVAETFVANMLHHEGWWVLHCYDYADSKIPKLTSWSRALVIPDIFAFNGKTKTRVWVEVKRKTKPTFYRKLQRFEHGFEMSLWEEYKLVEEVLGHDVWIVICEDDSGDVLFITLQQLREVVRPNHSKPMAAMIFWPRDAMQIFPDVKWIPPKEDK